MGESACVMQPLPVIPTEPIEVISDSSPQGDPLRGLNDSISFGRFATESLSWEKWSTFSHKKYVEEAERYSKPGSVAEKKAFFEAHYKKLASLKAAGLLEEANNPGQESVTGNGELKDHAQKDNTVSECSVKEGDQASKKEEDDTRKDGGDNGSFVAESVNLKEQGRNPGEQKQEPQMETLPPKDSAGSLPSSDRPLKKKRTGIVKFMGSESRSRPRTNEEISKRKEDKDKTETKRRSWGWCACFGSGQLEDRPNHPTDKKQVGATNSIVPQQRLETRSPSKSSV
ncbi:hypothetical protein MLD38_001076 [Melastoma candidum]|uniref:Uncharacterized protein n=1 Tax=Melastoma candidum TaxID=119954 RepID=A0ACB9SFE8_9MYRT|nr:hypothetical protein MLD38_001076 [Melastoma candidum]